MATNLALSNISANKARSALSIAGIATAIILIFMQLGFRGAIEDTATVIYDDLNFDLILRSPDYLQLVDARQIPRSILHDVAGLDDVRQVRPFHVSVGNWRHPQGKELRVVVIMGVEPGNGIFKTPATDQATNQLTAPEFVLIDQKTHHEYGPANGKEFGEEDRGVVTNVSNRRIEIAGHYKLGAGLTANGSVITSEQGFDRLTPFDAVNRVSMGMVELRPGVDPAQFAEQLRQRFRSNGSTSQTVDVLTRAEVEQQELRRWLNETPIGFVFTLGVIISFVVGAAIVYMILSSDVGNRLGEYATLKAMGYSNRYLAAVVLKQACYFAIFAFLPALAISLLLYAVTGGLANIAIDMTWTRVVFVFVLSLVMGGISGTLAIRKLWQAEPAELF